MWEGKVFAAADAADAADTNWKHKVTPDWGDLITSPLDWLMHKNIQVYV